MKKITFAMLIAISVCIFISGQAKAQTKVEVNAASDLTTGEKVRGPASIHIYNLNVLRYDIQIGRTVTFTGGPDLTLPFIPPIPTEGAKTTGGSGGSGLTASRFDQLFAAYRNELNRVESDRVNLVQRPILDGITGVNGTKDNLESLVSTSDSMLNTGGGPTAIIAGIRSLIEPAGTSVIDRALAQTWPDAAIENLILRLDVLENSVLTLPTEPVSSGQPTWSDWYKDGNKAAYDAVVARIDELQTMLTALRSANNAQAAALRNAQNKLRQWKLIMVGVVEGGANGFSRMIKVGCGFALSDTKETKLEIVKRDRLAESGTAATRQEVVTVVCSSPLSVSAGFGFSTVDEKEFIFVPSTKTVTNSTGQTSEVVINRFGFKNRSGFRTLPVLLLNTRVYEPSDLFAIHASAGAAVDVKSGQGGTDLEYIVGPSFSFKRTLFITPGLHIGRVPSLVGGFKLDQEVPAGISEPPIEKTWKTGLVVTFTFKIR
jgi:hypothetical protein